MRYYLNLINKRVLYTLYVFVFFLTKYDNRRCAITKFHEYKKALEQLLIKLVHPIHSNSEKQFLNKQ